jgi:hypothetical protein
MKVIWEKIESNIYECLYRAKIPGGWLIVWRGTDDQSGMTLCPDVNHEWDGNSLP